MQYYREENRTLFREKSGMILGVFQGWPPGRDFRWHCSESSA